MFGGFFARRSAVKPDVTASTPPSLDRVILHVTWRTPEEIADSSPGNLAFTRGPQLLSDGEWHAWITVPPPDDFNDHDRIETLGHEVFHALGARHAAPDT